MIPLRRRVHPLWQKCVVHHTSRLAGDGRIRRRVKGLPAAAAEHVALSRADMIQMMLADQEEARANGQMAATIHAAELLGRELHGMFTERREVIKRDDLRKVPEIDLYEQAAQHVEFMGERDFAAKIRRMAQS
jgi:hypothetical protein